MEWLSKDWRSIIKWEKERPPGHLLGLFSFVRSIGGEDSHDAHARDDEFDNGRLMALDFCIGLAYGIILGIGLMMYWVYLSRVRSRERQDKASSMAALSAMDLDDVRKFFPQEYVPYWIVMGKYEKVDWINHCVRKIWPFYTELQSANMKEAWEAWIDPYRPPSISQLSFSKFSLGSIPPILLGVRMVYATGDEIAMDVECQWQGDPCIILKVRTALGLTLSLQIKDVVMLVVLRVIFRPLVDELPGFGAFTYSIRKERKFDFNLRLVGGDIATIPGPLGSTVEEMLRTAVLDTLMWPMRIPVPVIPSPVDRDLGSAGKNSSASCGPALLHLLKGRRLIPFFITYVPHASILHDHKVIDQYIMKHMPKEHYFSCHGLFVAARLQRHFNPRRGAVLYSENGTLRAQAIGILDVKLVQAKDLKLKKTALNVGAFAFLYIRPVPRLMKRSKTITNDVNPVWNEIYELEVEDVPTQKLTVKILDESGNEQDEMLGCCQVLLKDIEPGVLAEKWIKLVKYLDKEDLKYRGEVNLEILYRPYDQECPPMWIQEGRSPRRTSSPSGSRTASSLFSEDMKSPDHDRAPAIHPGFSYEGQLWEIVRGVLAVTVERAENLVSQDVFSLSDPYVVLKMKKSKQRKQTKVVYKNLNPEWNQTFNFLVEDGIHEMLLLKVWDHDTFGKDFLGSCATTLTKAIHNGECRHEFKLTDVPSGVLFLTLKWTPMSFEKIGKRRSTIYSP